MAGKVNSKQGRFSGSWREHGGVNAQVLGEISRDNLSSSDPLIDFSVNLNDYGPSPGVQKALRESTPWTYPNPDYPLLKAAIGMRHPHKQIVVGNGAADLLWSMAQTFVAQDYTAVILEPTFCEFRYAWLAALKTAGKDPDQYLKVWNRNADNGFALDLEGFWHWLELQKMPVVIYWCNPNSPTGHGIDPRIIDEGIKKNPKAVVILDEAFWSLCDLGPSDSQESYQAEACRVVSDQVIQLRSLTKDHAIAGVRLGYLAAHADWVALIEGHRPPWMVSTLAHDAGIAALGEDGFVAESWQRIKHDRQVMVELLREAGITPLPTTTLFMMIPVFDGTIVRSELLKQGILVRDTASYGHKGFIRVCTRKALDAQRLAAALRRLGI